jgi:HEAT repeat protein
MSPRRALWLVSVLLVGTARAAGPDPEVVYAEKTLKDANLGTDGPALLRFFRERSLTDADRARLPEAVRRLGDEDFDTREKAAAELLRAGRKALPFLRPALGDTDPERARRAARCVEEIEGGEDQLRVVAAARLLTDRRPEGAAAALLGYLPADDEVTEEAVFQALRAVGTRDGKPDPALPAALADPEPLRRAAAAHVLGRAAPGKRDAVRRLLADGDARVRFEAAQALLHGGEKEGVPALIALLGDGPMPLAWRAQEVLSRLGGERVPQGLSDEEPAKRAAVADAWRAWWKDAAPTIDLAKINLDEALQGINIICEFPVGNPEGRVWACRADKKMLWEIKGLAGPIDVQLLPGDRILVAENEGRRVTERDRTGKVLWSKNVNDFATACRRLPNGNTFIATQSAVMEVDPKGTPVWTRESPGGYLARAHRLPDGHLLLGLYGDKLVELDAAGKEVRQVKFPPGVQGWTSVEPLSGNRYLVAVREANKVFELDTKGNILWECSVTSPMSAVRMPGGNVLVSCWDSPAVIEIDRAGKEVWKLPLPACGGRARRY